MNPYEADTYKGVEFPEQAWDRIAKLPQIEPQTVHHFASGLYCKEIILPAGCEAVQHRHNYSHMSVLCSGTAAVTVGDHRKVYIGPSVIHIVADELHRVEALSECVWLCIHATEETDKDKVDAVLVKKS